MQRTAWLGTSGLSGKQASIDWEEIMGLHQLFSSLLIRWFGGILLVFSAFSVMHAQIPTAPTASEDPAKIDHIWQRAGSKYDAERTVLLKEVDALANQGPFRPDWESLQKYESPEWYQDAKFGGPDGLHVQLPAQARSSMRTCYV